MSQTPNQQPDPENGNERDIHPDQPPSAQNQPSQEGSNIGDSSWPIFSMYSKIAEEEDNKMTDRWTKDADGILIFTGLFSASVAALLAVSIQDLIPNSQDTSAFYLEKIFEQLYLNATPSSVPSNIPRPPPFSPPTYAIWVNSLWFLSLVISLNAALLATSLQQWARRYVRITQPPRCSPEKRARMRAFFADGAEKLHIPWAVEGLPALLHLSLFLFFSGVLIFLFNINHTVFWWVIWSVGVSLTMYGWMTVIPIFRYDSPYYAPLSGSAWLIYTGISYAFFKFLALITSIDCFTGETRSRFIILREHYYRWMAGGVEKAAEETASKRSSAIDLRILDWTLRTLGEDDLLEKFFGAIPGFFNSSLVNRVNHPPEVREKFGEALARFLWRTLSSNSILDSVKCRRLIICIDAADVVDVPYVIPKVVREVQLGRLSLPQSIETGHALARWCNNKDSTTALPLRYIVGGILMAVSERDDRWIALAKDQYGLPEHVLRDNIAHGDNSVLLSILIHLTRQAFHSSYDPSLGTYDVLSSVSQFDICHTIPGLQHEFCALRNELVLEARKQGDYSHPVLLLRAIHLAYIALHQGTEAALTAFPTYTPGDIRILYSSSSYPLCTLASHRSDSTLDGPHPAHIETQPRKSIIAVADISISEANPVHATAQQAEETIITHSHTHLAITRSDNTSPHTHPFPSASPTTEPVQILPQVTSLSYPSILTQDLNPPAPIEVSHELRQSALLDTETAVLADPTAYIHTTETIETSRASATPLTFLHPHPILDTVIPSAVVSGLADVSNTFQRPTSAAILSHPQENIHEHDTAMPGATTYISEIQSAAHSIPQSISGGGATLETDEESTRVPPIVVSLSESSPIPMSAPHINVIPEESSSFIESPLVQSDSTLGSPSSSATTRSQIALQVTSVLEAHVTGSITAVSGPGDTHGMDTRILMEDFPYSNQSTAPAPCINPVTLAPEDGKDGRN